jgi:hypothetical protein
MDVRIEKERLKSGFGHVVCVDGEKLLEQISDVG